METTMDSVELSVEDIETSDKVAPEVESETKENDEVPVTPSKPPRQDKLGELTPVEDIRNRLTNFSNNMASKAKKPTDVKEIIGAIEDEFECVHKNVHGTLYLGPNALCFLGKVFFVEWKVEARWQDIAHIYLLERGVRVVARTNSEEGIEEAGGRFKVYDFGDMLFPLQHKDRCYQSLVSFHNKTLVDTGTEQDENVTPRSINRAVRRLNSDPVHPSSGLVDLTPTPSKDTDESTGEITNSTAPEDDEDSSAAQAAPSIATGTASAMATDTTISTTSSTTTNESSKVQLKTRWSEILEDKDSYSETAVENHELPCDLKSFFSMFLADDAKYPIPLFMKENGDDDIQNTEWANSTNTASGDAKSRVIEYSHPVNAPMAPPMARAKKEQTYQLFDDYGLTLETKTFVADVPMTDCFFVADRIRVQSHSEGKVQVTMQFDIRFIKGTMFKSVISRTTKREIHNFMNNLAKFMSKCLGEAEKAISDEAQQQQEPAIAEPAPTSERPSFSASLPVYILLGAVISLQLWIIWDMRTMKADIRDMQLNLARECVVPDTAMLMRAGDSL